MPHIKFGESMHRPLPVSEQQMQQIFAFIHSETRMTPKQFLYKWDVTQEFIAELCQCNERTVKRWIKGKFGKASSHRSHQLKLFIADLILSNFEGLPDNLKSLFCPNWKR
jgi:hypothetical protein